MLYYNLSKAFSIGASIAAFMCLLSVNLGLAQDSEPSPWSRFGLGLNVPSYSLPQQLMGGVSAPIMSGNVINPEQPASAAGCTTTLFQSSVYGSGNGMTEGDSSTTAITGNMGAFSLVVKKPGGKSAMMFGMHPYSAKGYNLSRTLTDDVVGDIIERYQGSGGTAKSYMGFAHAFRGRKWVKAGEADSVMISSSSMYLGGQVNYLFGEVIQQSRLDIQDITYLDYRSSTSMRHRSLGGLFGVQAFKVLGAKYDDEKNFVRSTTLYIGGTYATSSTLLTDYEKIVETVQLLSSVETPVDTASYNNILDKEGQIPSRWTAGAGIAFESKSGSRLLLSADMMQEDWTSVADDIDYLMEGHAEWAKASRLSVGMSFRPSSGGNRIYKAGFSMEDYPVSYEGYQLSGWKAAGGLTIPLEGSRSNSSLHMGVEFGQRSLKDADGIVLDNTLQESIFNFHIGVSLAPFFKNLWLTPKLYD